MLFIPLVLQGLTGAILVFEHEITHKDYKISYGENHKLSEIISSAQTAVDNEFKANFVRFDDAAFVRFSKENSKERIEVVVDPFSLEVLEIKNSSGGFFRIIKRFHENLLIGAVGQNIVGIYGFVMLFMTISGIILWWPKTGMLKRALTFKISDKGKKFHRDVHGAIGFYLTIPLFIIAFSGVYLIYPNGTHAFIDTFFSARNLREMPKASRVESDMISIDEALKIADEDNLISASIPTKKDQPYRFNFAPENYSEGAPMITVFVDPYVAKIIEKRDPKNYSIGEKIIAWQHALHAGEEFGLVSKTINFLAGLSILLFSITGIMLWLIKRKSKKNKL